MRGNFDSIAESLDCRRYLSDLAAQLALRLNQKIPTAIVRGLGTVLIPAWAHVSNN